MKMAAVRGLRALLSLHRTVTLQPSLGFVPVQLTSTGVSRGLSSSDTKSPCEPLPSVNPENESLLKNLNLMGVDVTKARKRQPGVLRKACTNEQAVAQFLEGKGASHEEIGSIVSRYPRAITRSIEQLEQRWELWRNIIQTDAEVVTILCRSPESFFRSSDNGNLEKNIDYLISLGLNAKALIRLLKTAPRTFSNSVELNRQMVELLEVTCIELGGKNPEQFAKVVLSRNLYILIRSIKRVKTNISMLRGSLKLSDSELLAFLEGPGAEILDLSSEYLMKNFNSLKKRMVSLGCRQADIRKFIRGYPTVLYIGLDTLSTKLDCLLKEGITMGQIVEKPKVLEYSTQNIADRLEKLKKVGYDFKKNGISVLDSSQKRFDAKLERLSASVDQ